MVFGKIISFYKCKKCGAGKSCYVEALTDVRGACLEGANKVLSGCAVKDAHIGYATYLSFGSKMNNAYIGRFCSIGEAVKIVRGKHPTERWVSTHPSFFSSRGQAGVIYSERDRFDELNFVTYGNKEWSALIGNDVWIGSNVLILDGVSIGDGAIIAAGSVVINDVPPYAIVAGVPAKVKKYRFSEENIVYLEQLKWWDKDEKWIKKYAKHFDDIEKLKKCLDCEEQQNG